jgi:predicted ATPase
MLRIKRLRLKNYCGYKDTTFNFCPNGRWIPMAIFFGPNGIGKSTGLNAIRLLTAGKEFKGRDMDLVLRSLVHNDEYNPDLSGYTPPSEEMLIEGVFDENGEEKVVRVEALYWEVEHVGVRPTPTDFIGHEYCMVNCRVKGEMRESDSAQEWIITMFQGGFVRNDLESKQEKSVLFLDSDNPINMKKFQIPETRAKLFIEMGEAVYGYPCSLSSPVVSGAGDKEMKFFADFILGKGGGKTKIHFKRMSDGEKKIATMLRTLCNPTEIDEPDIVLIDNIEMHIYFKRHPKLVEKLLECFPNKQFLVTTHSAVLIQYVMERNADRNEQNWLFDIEQYKPQEAMTL